MRSAVRHGLRPSADSLRLRFPSSGRRPCGPSCSTGAATGTQRISSCAAGKPPVRTTERCYGVFHGTAFCLAPNLFLTAAHVFREAQGDGEVAVARFTPGNFHGVAVQDSERFDDIDLALLHCPGLLAEILPFSFAPQTFLADVLVHYQPSASRIYVIAQHRASGPASCSTKAAISGSKTFMRLLRAAESDAGIHPTPSIC